jgi:hypothetical protein
MADREPAWGSGQLQTSAVTVISAARARSHLRSSATIPTSENPRKTPHRQKNPPTPPLPALLKYTAYDVW